MLYVRSTPDDLTTRARIRDAAIACFGSEGFAKGSLRTIAAAAGVSPALILHHFGSKEGLREACDAYVVGSFMDEGEQFAGRAAAEMMRAALDDLDHRAPLIDYLARMLVDDSPASDALFDALLHGTTRMLAQQIESGVVRPLDDLPAMATYITLYGLGPVIMRRQLARAFGEQRLTTRLMERSALPVLELFTHGIYTDDRLLRAAREAVQRGQDPASGPAGDDPSPHPGG